MLHDFQNLKTISVADGEVALRIPQRWDVRPQEGQEACWECCEPGDAETGTLWIQVDRFRRDGQPMPSLTREFVEALEEDANAESPPPLESTIVPLDGGYLWRRVFDVEEEGEMLRFWFSRFFLERGAENAVISINFVLGHTQMNEPAFAHLPAVMDREVGRAFLDPFRTADETEAERALGPLRRINFADQIRLVLPKAVGCWPHGGRGGDVENQWYCRLDTETSHAGMFVLTEEYPLSEEDDAGALALLADDPEDPRPASITLERGYARRTPWGTVSYEWYDDDPGERTGETDDPPLRNHLWTHIWLDGTTCRRLRVLLMIPLPELDAPPFPQFVDYMDGAVRRADLPALA